MSLSTECAAAFQSLRYPSNTCKKPACIISLILNDWLGFSLLEWKRI